MGITGSTNLMIKEINCTLLAYARILPHFAEFLPEEGNHKKFTE